MAEYLSLAAIFVAEYGRKAERALIRARQRYNAEKRRERGLSKIRTKPHRRARHG